MKSQPFQKKVNLGVSSLYRNPIPFKRNLPPKLIENNCSFNRFGITFDPNCENNTIQGNSINNNTEYGINLMESSTNYIKENTVNNNGVMGINLEPNCPYNEIVNNTANFNGWTGIHMQNNSTNNLIMSNNCSYNGNGIIVRTPNNTISENTIEYNSGVGIHLWGSHSINNTLSNNITRNFIYSNNYGFLLGAESALNIIEGNQIIDNTGPGVMISADCFDNLIFNNKFIDNINVNADNGNYNNWNSSTLGNYWDDYSGKKSLNVCMYTYIHMTSKNISITEDVYKKLMKIKRENESFSELFLRLLKIQKINMEKSFGAWNLSAKEKVEIWEDITNRPGRSWKNSEVGEIK